MGGGDDVAVIGQDMSAARQRDHKLKGLSRAKKDALSRPSILSAAI